MLVYSSVLLQEKLKVAGDIKAVLYVDANVKDSDVVVKLVGASPVIPRIAT